MTIHGGFLHYRSSNFEDVYALKELLDTSIPFQSYIIMKFSVMHTHFQLQKRLHGRIGLSDQPLKP